MHILCSVICIRWRASFTNRVFLLLFAMHAVGVSGNLARLLNIIAFIQQPVTEITESAAKSQKYDRISTHPTAGRVGD